MWNKKIYKYSLCKLSFRLAKLYNIIFGNYGIKSLQCGLISQKHIENVRRKLSKQFKKLNTINKTKIFIRFNVWKPYTCKPMLSRMGKGAGVITYWKALIRKGYILFELLSSENSRNVSNIVKRSIYCFPIKLLLLKKS